MSATYFKDSRNSESMIGDNNVANNNVALFRRCRMENVNFNRQRIDKNGKYLCVCVCVSRMFPHFEISLVSGMKLKILVHVIASNVIGNLRLA